MIHYFENIPSAAVFRHFDGNLYANVACRITPDGVQCGPRYRVVRFDERSKIQNGVASVYIGRMGDAIAQTNNLPFSVSYEVQP